MARKKSLDKRQARNITMLDSVFAIGQGLVRTMCKNSLSQLLADLIMAEQQRQASGENQNLSELLAENRKLKEQLNNCKEDFRAFKAVVKREFAEQLQNTAVNAQESARKYIK